MKKDDDELLWDVRTPSGLFAEAYQSNKGTFLLLYKHDNTIFLEQDDMVMLLKTLNDYQKKESMDKMVKDLNNEEEWEEE